MVSTAPEDLAPAGLEGKKVLERLLLPELKRVARELGLKVGGTKAAILQRIVDYATIFVVYDVTLTDLKLFVFEPNDDLGREEKLVFDPDKRKALWATSLRDAVGGLEDTDCVLPLDEELNAVERDVLAETLRRMGEDDLSRTLLGDENEASAPNAVTGGTGAAPTPLLLRLTLMAGLAVQYGLQTYFQHRYLSKRVNKLGLVFCCEVVKLAIASAALAVEALRGGERAEIFSRKTARSVMLCSLPALIYVIQNLCVQTAYSELDSITFNCLNQTKLITTAAALFAIKGVRQSARQMVALGLVSGGAMLLAVRDSGGQRAAAGAGEATAKGVAMILAAAGLSGVAATLTQIFMQDMRLSPFLVTVSMCMVSIATVGGSILSQAAINGEPLAAVFDHWTALSVVPVITQALGGMLVGLVTNYCGSINKGIAFVCGLAVSAVCECAVTGVMLPWNALLALVFVAQGSFMHTKESILARERAVKKKD